MKKFAWLLVAVLVQIICAADDDLVVKTANGPVKGHLVTSYNGRTAIAFEGIPFAKPPVGELRFKEPQPPEPWNDVLEANKKYTCLQYVSLEGEGGTSGDEDCLYLYVYVPRENINPDEKLDVAIHIHSGAFCSGDPHTWASYEYIMDKDLIYVTLNYRLGSLGFLSTQDSVVPGNNGLKDQALAMRWVKRNIRNFGGNPDAITLTGFSAGGSSVHLHYLSPWSTGLFVRGMSHSGTALNVYSLVKNPLQKAQKLGALFNCTTASSKEMVDCLRSKPVKDVARAHGHFYAFINLLPVVPFGPVIEYGVRFPFLPDHPYRLIAEGRINDVPWVSSNTKNEGIAPVGFIYLHDKLKELDRRWEELAPVVLEFNDTANEIDKTLIARAVRQHYFGNDSVSINNGQNLIDLYTERLYIADNIKAIVAHAKVAKSPVYYYRFDYFLENPVFYKGNLSGVPHGEDARVLYRQGDISLKLAAADSRMKDILVNFLYDYAHTGIPTFKGNTWDPLYSTSNPTSYLRIFSPDTIRKERALDLEGFNFWNQFPLFENEKVLPYLPRAFVQTAYPAEDLVVTTEDGPVKGHPVTSFNGRTATAFEGIPFAKPPVGELRFKEPEPPQPWNEVLEANKKYTCLQYVSLTDTMGDEDCLYLYVYVPREKINPDEKLDVVLHLHSGAFSSGDPHTWASYEYIMDKDVIYVTFNYRLGSLGFLSTQDNVVPGNNGLKDQSVAMRWVTRNIKNFGGNPDSITLTGFSAGASCAHLHYLSPWSTGLFHRGMSHSGTALNVYSLVKTPLANAKRLGALLNCTTASTKAMVDCLRNKPVEDVVKAHGHFYAFINLLPLLPFGPVVEHGTPTPFLPDHPYKLITEGRINDVPWVSSNSKDEGIAPVGFMYLNDKVKELDRRWEELAPVVLEFNDTANEEDKSPIARAVRKHYFGNDSIEINNGKNLIDLYTDRLYIADNIKAIMAHAKAAKSPVYYYRFEYFLENPVFYKGNLSGVPHGEDARVLYRQGDSSLKLAEADGRMKDILIDFLYDYAHTGVPKFKGNPWDPLFSTPGSTNYLRIFSPDTIRRERALDFKGYNFWKKFPLFENENALNWC